MQGTLGVGEYWLGHIRTVHSGLCPLMGDVLLHFVAKVEGTLFSSSAKQTSPVALTARFRRTGFLVFHVIA